MVKQNPRRKKIGLLPKLVLLAVFIYTLVVLISMYGEIDEAKAEVDLLQQQVDQQKQQNDILAANDAGSLTDEVIASIVRDKLGYVLPGELIFKDEAAK